MTAIYDTFCSRYYTEKGIHARLENFQKISQRTDLKQHFLVGNNNFKKISNVYFYSLIYKLS